MALICLRCTSANCTRGLLATVLARSPRAAAIEDPIEPQATPVLASSAHIIAVADEPTAELETLFVLKPP